MISWGNFGSLQRIFKEIEETSDQFRLDFTWPFTRIDSAGQAQFGVFADHVERSLDQDSYGNFNDPGSALTFESEFEDFYTDVFPTQDHPIDAGETDVDYQGEQDIFAVYTGIQYPFTRDLRVSVGARFESTSIQTTVQGEEDALLFIDGAPLNFDAASGDASTDDDFLLPAVSLIYDFSKEVRGRAAFSETIARQTFRELTPVFQQEFVGAPVFIGNPGLEISEIKNYDLRLDYTPFEGGLFSVSWFKKDLDKPIEVAQEINGVLTYTTPRNFKKGELQGFEFEYRQELSRYWPRATGWSVGANATFINTRVFLPDDLAAEFNTTAIQAPQISREMTDAPQELYNLFVTYDDPDAGTRAALFYTIEGDKLLAGAGVSTGNFVPDIYQESVGTLNLTYSQRLSDAWTLNLAAKNLTNPEIETEYRSVFTGPDTTFTSFTRGREFSIGINWRP